MAKNKLAQAALQKQVADLQVSLTAEKDSASKANAAKTAALEENFKQRELAIMSEVEAAEAKVKEFERKNVQTVSEMKQQANSKQLNPGSPGCKVRVSECTARALLNGHIPKIN